MLKIISLPDVSVIFRISVARGIGINIQLRSSPNMANNHLSLHNELRQRKWYLARAGSGCRHPTRVNQKGFREGFTLSKILLCHPRINTPLYLSDEELERL